MADAVTMMNGFENDAIEGAIKEAACIAFADVPPEAPSLSVVYFSCIFSFKRNGECQSILYLQ